jgi:hypothetical protein
MVSNEIFDLLLPRAVHAILGKDCRVHVCLNLGRQLRLLGVGGLVLLLFALGNFGDFLFLGGCSGRGGTVILLLVFEFLLLIKETRASSAYLADVVETPFVSLFGDMR